MGKINKSIDLLEQGHAVFTLHAMELTYEAGCDMAQTWADWIWVDFEHAPFDVVGLGKFMEGLWDGGPTPSGHQTPTVVGVLPARGHSQEEVYYNAWQVSQILSTGVHGIQLCHASDPEAVRAFVACARYPFQTAGRDSGLPEGFRGSGRQEYTSKFWNLDAEEYVKKADPWPLNPDGELLLGVKIEDRYALPNVDSILSVPGISFCDWGVTDMAMSLGQMEAIFSRDKSCDFNIQRNWPYSGELKKSLEVVKSACDRAGVVFSGGWIDQTVTHAEWVKTYVEVFGGRIASAPSKEFADVGRKLTGRSMPV